MTSEDNERAGMYKCVKTGVRIAKGKENETHYVVELPNGIVHELPDINGPEELNTPKVTEILNVYGQQVY